MSQFGTVKPLDMFPYKELTPLPTTREPNYNDILALQQQLNANAMSVDSESGSGNHGFLALVVDAATHFAITAHVWVPPTKPPMVPLIQPNTSSSEITIILEAHKSAKVEWANHNNTLKELRSQLLKAVPRDLIEELKDATSDFNNVTPLHIMTFLMEMYGTITPEMLKANLEKM